jgi:transcriptional regulator with XRE-family HTH domain
MKEFQRERLANEVTELISRVMREQKVTRAELADRLGKSRPFVTKLLRGGSNMTIRTIADVFHALGLSLRVVERPLSMFTPRLTVFEVHGVHAPATTMTFADATGGKINSRFPDSAGDGAVSIDVSRYIRSFGKPIPMNTGSQAPSQHLGQGAA